MTKDEFLEKAHRKHGYKYQYPNLKDKILLTDDIDVVYDGKLYKQKVVNHIKLGRCPEKNTPSKTTGQFISEAKLVWGDKYDYSLVEYKGALNKVKIIYDGVIFEQIASSHLNGRAAELNTNLEYFLKRAKRKWGDKYDYSLVEYKSSKDKVKIIYNGKIYEQCPTNHYISAPELVTCLKTTEEFIDQCTSIHNGKYIYDKTVYTLSKNKVTIKCPIHGYFDQVANSHFSGLGCAKCGFMVERDRKNKTTDQFISEARSVWGDKYDYSLTEYKNARTKVKIIYDGIIYKQLPNGHLKYPVESFLDQDIFLERAKRKWGDKYDYSLVKFIDTKNRIKIIYDGIIYEQLPHNHLFYAPEKILRTTQDEFIEKSINFHGNKYSYDEVVYKKSHDKVVIICNKHGKFSQRANVHYRSGCPHCNDSKGERSIAKYLNSKDIHYVRQHKFDDCKNIFQLSFDFYIPSLRSCVEFDGIQHFESVEYFGGDKAFNQLKINDKIKTDYCEDNYINLIRIRYDQIDRIDKILSDNIIPHR